VLVKQIYLQKLDVRITAQAKDFIVGKTILHLPEKAWLCLWPSNALLMNRPWWILIDKCCGDGSS